MTAAAPGSSGAGIVQRRNPRFPAHIAIDLTVLRSGVPDNIPGRALNLCEGGLAAVVASELRCGDSVGVQFRLPHVAVPFQARAVIRHEARLRYGLEFVGLSPEHHAMIRYWAGLVAEASRESQPRKANPKSGAGPARKRFWTPKLRRGLWIVLGTFAFITAVGWWHWYRVWDELESELPAKTSQADTNVPDVPGETMQVLVTHKVEPIYPEAAREANLQGLVLVRAVVAADGNVVAVHPVSGPDVLTQAAADAVRWWRFKPYRVNGQAQQVETTVALEFHP